jgi:hypothetical protein
MVSYCGAVEPVFKLHYLNPVPIRLVSCATTPTRICTAAGR